MDWLHTFAEKARAVILYLGFLGFMLLTMLPVVIVKHYDRHINGQRLSTMPKIITEVKQGKVRAIIYSDEYISTVPHNSAEPELYATLAGQEHQTALFGLLDIYSVEYQQHQITMPWYQVLFIAFFFILAYFKIATNNGNDMSRLPSWLRPNETNNTVGRKVKINTRFSDIAGCDEAKEELVETIEFLRNDSRTGRLGSRPPNGLLLIGPPGTGKTLLARAIAGEAGVNFITVAATDFVGKWMHETAKNIRTFFEGARKQMPCIVFIDEIDAIASRRNDDGSGGMLDHSATINCLLNILDGFDRGTRGRMVFIAATNRVDSLDPAILRPGRFDRQILVDLPDTVGRKAILGIHTRNKQLSVDISIEAIANQTAGFSGADLENLMNEAALIAERDENNQSITMQHISVAIERVMSGIERKTKRILPEEKRRIAIHEAGHAVASAALNGTTSISKISIISRGKSLGATYKIPPNDRVLMTEAELINEVVILLAGRAAEQLYCNSISTGAADDLSRVMLLVRSMVTEYGMSESLPNLSLVLPDGEMIIPSSAISAKIGEDIKSIVERAFETAKQLLEANKQVVEALSAKLIDQESLHGDELLTILNMVKAKADPTES